MFVWDHYAARDPECQFLQRQGADRKGRAVRGGILQDENPVQVDQNSGVNPGEDPAALLADLVDRTLAMSTKLIMY